MKKQTLTTIIASVLSLTVVISTGTAVAMRGNDTVMSFTSDVAVKDGRIVENAQPTYFNPVGQVCTFDISIAGPDEILSDIRICTEMPNNEPVFSTTTNNSHFSTGELDVQDQGIFLMISHKLVDGETVEDNEFAITYTVRLSGTGDSAWNNGLTIFTTAAVAVFVVFMIYILNRNMMSNKEYDERQIRMRGLAALNSLVTAACVLMGFGLLDNMNENFPFSVYQVAMITVMVSITVFMIISDINDAYFGIRSKRTLFIILSAIIAVTQLMSGLLFGLIRGGEPVFSNLNVVSTVTGLCFAIFCIELIIKGNIEKRELREEAEDEESET
ncbi:hypothetical protein SAMN02910456_01811 [Ruminococcaceae bacterium YRB3002]|nr:hypothetical protein SAMN02910456_01811 [Ruminococcaceae bacterium YRB3002]